MHSIALSYNLHKRASSSNNLTETQQESGNNQSHGELLVNTLSSRSRIIGRSFSGSFFSLLHNEINVSLCGQSISHSF